MYHLSQKITIASVASLLTAAILVAASSLLTTTINPGGVAYAQEEEEIDLELTLESVSWDPKTKQVTVEFTSTCPTGSGDGPWLVRVEQNRGGKVISGDQFGPGELACDIHEFVTIEADERFFVPGRAIVHVDGLVCGVDVCDEDIINEEVRLSARG
jgi:hypothetical protein